ncbi:MAG: DsbA family protein [Planctomycetota bacterium]|jgi:putative protein-disulfide isomerase
MNPPDRQLVYIADPMCSWCWGFSPVIHGLVDLVRERAGFSVVMGGLRSETQPVSLHRKSMFQKLYPHITQKTGQPIHCELVYTDDFVYDSEPPCRAVVTAREMSGDLEALELFTRLQRAFYVENQDITRADVCVSLAGEVGLDAGAFADRFSSDEYKEKTQEDFHHGRLIGAGGFPTVVLMSGSHGEVLSHGYQPIENLREPLERWLGT